jgi:hypothetical protein
MWVYVDAGPKSDAEALEIGVKKFDAMVRNHNSGRSSFGTDPELDLVSFSSCRPNCSMATSNRRSGFTSIATPEAY